STTRTDETGLPSPFALQPKRGLLTLSSRRSGIRMRLGSGILSAPVPPCAERGGSPRRWPGRKEPAQGAPNVGIFDLCDWLFGSAGGAGLGRSLAQPPHTVDGRGRAGADRLRRDVRGRPHKDESPAERSANVRRSAALSALALLELRMTKARDGMVV